MINEELIGKTFYLLNNGNYSFIRIEGLTPTNKYKCLQLKVKINIVLDLGSGIDKTTVIGEEPEKRIYKYLTGSANNGLPKTVKGVYKIFMNNLILI